MIVPWLKKIQFSNFIPWFLFILSLTIYFLSTVGIMNSLDAPQFALTKQIVEGKTFKLNNSKYIRWAYPDIVTFQNNTYSVRTIGESVMAIPFYIFAKSLLPFTNYPYEFGHPGITQDSKIEVVTILYNATFGAGVVVMTYFISLELSKSKYSSFLTALVVGFGTLFWRYNASFQRFSTVTFFLLLAFFVLLKYAKNNKWHDYHSILFGSSLGSVFAVDPSNIFLVSTLLAGAFFILKKGLNLRKLLFIFLPMTILVSTYFAYNSVILKDPLKSPYLNMSTKPYQKTIGYLYQIPLYQSVVVNLFNNGPIPRSTFPESFWGNTQILSSESFTWAIINQYKGIFVQSPFLLLSLIGLLLRLKNSFTFLAISLAAIGIIQNSKYVYFFGPNAYDTHYFLPIVPFIGFGFSVFLKKVSELKKLEIKIALGVTIAYIVLVSFLNGWYSNLTNFAPHVTGEHRFYLSQLYHPLASLENINANLKLLFINTFPNIFNFHILIPYFILCFLAQKLLTTHKILKKMFV